MSYPPIFISYRRDDARWPAGMIAERLMWAFGDEAVFFDRKSISPGASWPDALRAAVTASKVFVVIIGKDWLAADALGQRRIDDEEDWVRQELQLALKSRHCLVIPLLVDEAKPPVANLLPQSLAHLTECQCKAMRELPDLEHDLLALVRAIERHLHVKSKPFTFEARKQLMAESLRDQAGKNRRKMLEKVRQAWVEGLLEKALHVVNSFSLGLEYAPEAVVKQRGLPDATLRDSRDIAEVFIEWERQLLILGAPGGGKTTLMLHLAQELLNEAEANVEKPIPVVFNLSSWGTKRLPLREWLTESLQMDYQVPTQVGKNWLEGQHLLLLLDGLDEVGAQPPYRNDETGQWVIESKSETIRRECVDAINDFLGDFPKCPMVICSRPSDYEKIGVLLKLPAAVTLQPLALERAMSFLSGNEYIGLREALANDSELKEMMTVPFLLNLARIAYRNKAANKLMLPSVNNSEEAKANRRDDLIETYIEAQLTAAVKNSSVESTHFPRRKVRQYLTLLADQMQRNKQSVFYVEDLQYDWLQNGLARLSHVVISSLMFGTIAGIFGGFLFAFLASKLDLSEISKSKTSPLDSASITTIFCSVFSLLTLLSALGRLAFEPLCRYGWRSTLYQNASLFIKWTAVIAIAYFTIGTIPVTITLLFSQQGTETLRSELTSLMWVSPQLALLASVWILISRSLHYCMHKFRHWRSWMATPILVTTLIITIGSCYLPSPFKTFILLPAFIASISCLLIGTYKNKINITEALTWRWNWRLSCYASILHIIFVVTMRISLFDLERILNKDRPYTSDIWYLPGILGTFITYGIWGGIQKSQKITTRHLPAQGLKQTLRSSIFIIIAFALSGPLLSFLDLLLRSAFDAYILKTVALENFDVLMSNGLIFGVTEGLIVGLFVSGSDSLIKHWILRLQLKLGGTMPFRLVSFMNYSVECLLTRRVGAGYIFLHRYVLDHFAQRHSKKHSISRTVRTQE